MIPPDSSRFSIKSLVSFFIPRSLKMNDLAHDLLAVAAERTVVGIMRSLLYL